jgi:hypothetical protein
LVSTPSVNAGVIEGDLWAIHAREGGTLGTLGTFESPYAWAPFVDTWILLLYRSDPVMIDKTETDAIVHGSPPIAWDFTPGKARWSFEPP